MQSREYFFCSKRIGFRWWTLDDFVIAKELWGDPEVTKLLSKAPLSDIKIRERLSSEIERAKTYGIQYWSMFELTTGQHIGCSGLRPYSPGESTYELGFHLRPSYWGKGFATEAGKAVLTYGLDLLDECATIFAMHHPDNTSSKNVLLKLGFEATGSSEFYEPTGLFHPSYLLASNHVRSHLESNSSVAEG
jgi:[ribosomal protein S5]-alanine N-acetyltransferase